MPYPDENIARDQAKAEYELALYKAGKKAAEVVEQYLQKNLTLFWLMKKHLQLTWHLSC